MRRLAAVPFLLALAAPAVAATPEGGTVSTDAPSIKWEGTATGYGIIPTNILLTTAGEDPAPCNAPYCDTFALKVADQHDLNVVAAQRGADNFTELHVIKPDGEILFVQSEDAEPARIRVKGAVPGDYTIEVMTNESVEQSGEYDASATLTVPAPPAPAPAPEPAPGAAAPPPAASLSLTTKSVSAKKKKKLRLAITSTGPVSAVKVQLRKGTKVLAKAALKSLDGKGSVTLKLRKKLKPGTYQFTMSATDGDRRVGLTTRLKVRK